MFKVKTPNKNSKYWIPTEDFRTALHWSLRYPLWVAELSMEPDTSQAIRYDKERVQTSGNYDATVEMAIRRDELIKILSLRVPAFCQTFSSSLTGKSFFSNSSSSFSDNFTSEDK